MNPETEKHNVRPPPKYPPTKDRPQFVTSGAVRQAPLGQRVFFTLVVSLGLALIIGWFLSYWGV